MNLLEKVRAETPHCDTRTHLNNAGASLQPRAVLDAVHQYLELESQLGGYEAADVQASAIAGFYSAMATLLHTQARNIAFATSATDAYNRVLSAFDWKKGDVILTTNYDYSSNQIAFLALQKRLGVQLIRAQDSPEGGVEVPDIEQLIQKHSPKLVAITHVPTSSGLVQPVVEIGKICRAAGVWYLVDACQSAGQIGLNVHEIGCDFLSATMRKFMRGPRGAGFLFVSDRALESGFELLLPDMRSADWIAPDVYQTTDSARRFEYWEYSPALLLGSKVAADYIQSIGMDWIENRVKHLAHYTRERLSELPGVRVLDAGKDLCGIVTAHANHWESAALMQKLHQANINCRLSSRMAAQIDFAQKGVDWALRVSPHYYNTEAEIDRMMAVLGR